MSTYAYHIIWLGVWKNHLPVELPDKLRDILQTLDQFGKVTTDEKFVLRAIGMHEEVIGYGEIVQETGLITTEDCPEQLDALKISALPAQLQSVKDKFVELGLPEDVRIATYHHIDLGG